MDYVRKIWIDVPHSAVWFVSGILSCQTCLNYQVARSTLKMINKSLYTKFRVKFVISLVLRGTRIFLWFLRILVISHQAMSLSENNRRKLGRFLPITSPTVDNSLVSHRVLA